VEDNIRAMDTSDLVGAVLATAAILGLMGVVFLVIRIVGPRRELAGVDAPPNEWGEVRLLAPSARGYRFWARVDVDGDEDSADLAADVDVRAPNGALAAATAQSLGGTRYWVSGGRFTSLLCTVPPIAASTPLALRARVYSVAGPSLSKVRLFVST
jgi:hypothetical protein